MITYHYQLFCLPAGIITLAGTRNLINDDNIEGSEFFGKIAA